MPAALAAAYRENCDGLHLLAAMVAGYEVAVRVAEMLHPWSTRNGFHNTPVAGVLGAAAAAAKVFGLPGRQLESALGIAASSASGLFAYLAGGGNVKKIHVGNAARSGFLAACLAKAGAVDGPMGVLEARHGLLQCFGGSVDPGQGLVTAEDDFAINRCYLKPYPCCRHLHPTIDAVLSLRKRHSISPEEISAVEVETFAAAAELRSVEWGSLFSAQLSFPFTLAIAIEFGEVTSSSYADAARHDHRVLRHIPNISIREDTSMTAAYPGIAPARVEVRTRSGEVYQERVLHPLGSVENPLSRAAVVEKFMVQGSARLPQGALHSVAEQVLHLERCCESRSLLDGLSQARNIKHDI